MSWMIRILIVISLAPLWVAIVVWPGLSARKRHQSIAALAGLFDAGTAKIDGTLSIRRHFLWPSIAGLFHGRPASVSVAGIGMYGALAYIRISVAGRFVLPFQVRAKTFSKLGLIRGGLGALAYAMYFLLVVPRDFFPTVIVWKFAAAPVILGVALISVWRNYGRIADIEFPKDARVEVSFPGSADLQFSTDFPAEFRAAIDRSEIQSSLLRLIETRRVDHLRAVVRSPSFPWREGWDSNAEANFFYRRKLLDQDAVRETLSDLLTLCERIESPGRADEALHLAVTELA